MDGRPDFRVLFLFYMNSVAEKKSTTKWTMQSANLKYVDEFGVEIAYGEVYFKFKKTRKDRILSVRSAQALYDVMVKACGNEPAVLRLWEEAEKKEEEAMHVSTERFSKYMREELGFTND